eukprot:3104477-Prymnesium_polylepis.1
MGRSACGRRSGLLIPAELECERAVEQHARSTDAFELQRDSVLEEHDRISEIHGKPWNQVPPESTVPRHWLDNGTWEQAERERERREVQEKRERWGRMARADAPPPRRDDPRYGQRADNTVGDESFRKDRAVWYEHVTGESLDG